MLSINSFETLFYLCQQISGIFLGKEKVESNFININGDLNWGVKKVQFYCLH